MNRYKKMWRTRRSSIVGKVFGRLTVLSQRRKRGRHRIKFWNCLCSCGNKTKASTSNLTGGAVVSCGCALFGFRKRPYERLYNRLLNNKLHSVNLTYKQFLQYTKTKECHYCSASINWDTTKGWNLDRKNNSKEYTKKNCVVCCWKCNKGKSNIFTYEERVEVGKILRSIRVSSLAS